MSERMIPLTTSVIQLWACFVLNGGWSDSWKRGVIQVTGGREPASMSRIRSSTGQMCSSQTCSSWKMSRIDE